MSRDISPVGSAQHPGFVAQHRGALVVTEDRRSEEPAQARRGKARQAKKTSVR